MTDRGLKAFDRPREMTFAGLRPRTAVERRGTAVRIPPSAVSFEASTIGRTRLTGLKCHRILNAYSKQFLHLYRTVFQPIEERFAGLIKPLLHVFFRLQPSRLQVGTRRLRLQLLYSIGERIVKPLRKRILAGAPAVERGIVERIQKRLRGAHLDLWNAVEGVPTENRISGRLVDLLPGLGLLELLELFSVGRFVRVVLTFRNPAPGGTYMLLSIKL